VISLYQNKRIARPAYFVLNGTAVILLVLFLIILNWSIFPRKQGLSLWDSGLKDRTTFFLGNWYFGADGFYENSEFKMYSEVLAASFANKKLQFNASNLIEDKGEVAKVRDKTRQLYALQLVWLKKYFCD